MPSLRKRVTSYFRQLSFHNEPREKRNNFNENSFITKYLQGQIVLKEGPAILYGKTPTDLPNYDLSSYETGTESIIGAYTGPNGGLTTVKRKEKHLSVLDADIDYIDTQDETVKLESVCHKSPKIMPGQPVDNTTMVIKVAGQEYTVTNRQKKHNKSHSLGSLSDFQIEIGKTKSASNENNNIAHCNNNNSINDQNKKVSNINKNVDTQFTNENNTSLHVKENITSDDDNINTKHNLNTKSTPNVVNNNEISKQCVNKNYISQAGSDLPSTFNETTTETVINNDKLDNNNIDHGKVCVELRKKTGKSCEASQSGDRKTKEIEGGINKEKVNRSISLSKENCNNDRDVKPYGLAKSKSEGNPFKHKKQGKIIQIERPTVCDDAAASTSSNTQTNSEGDVLLPAEWSRKSDYIFGISDSLYDKNQVTKVKNGDPIADCYGIIARKDSAILAVADGVNWGEKASIAAKSAIHGCLHYLNKTLFNDTGPFESLVQHDNLETASCASSSRPESSLSEIQIANTREVFVCLLRAFNCAHDLILENKGMLTTLTVAVVLPLSQSRSNMRHFEQYKEPNDVGLNTLTEKYVCCVCNVGDTLAYVYSQKYGMRELTKGSHDINCNRDMRDALGALGPVDGINPELSNLTLSVTTIDKGDIVMIASDGLSDNFDPNVCKFSVINPNPEPKPKKLNVPAASKDNKGRDVRAGSAPLRQTNPAQSSVRNRPKSTEVKVEQSIATGSRTTQERNKPPIKPPRRSKNRDSISRSSTDRSESVSIDENIEKKAPIASPTESLLTIATPQDVTKSITSAAEDKKQLNLYKSKERKTSLEMKANFEEKAKITSRRPTQIEGHAKREADKTTVSKGNEEVDKANKKIDNDEVDNPLVAQFLRDNSLDTGSNTFERVKNALISPAKINMSKADSGRASQRGVATATSSQPKKQNVTVKVPPTQKSESLTRKTEAPRQHYKLQHSKSMDVKKNESKLSQKQPESPKTYAFLRSKTTLEIRPKNIWRNADGLPYVTPMQRYELTLLLMEDILKKGISGKESQVVTAKKLCENLLSFTFSITAAKRHTLEDNDLYFDNRNGVMFEISAQDKKIRRKRALERIQNLPGKLDHVTVVAYNVGLFSH